ncbi:MAG: amidohydrolase family protein [Erythrobacter sp.]|uniref:amidohydrolase family protein n=1 Tax=Erythrobacter sp. TaxID=1042 RepID=UPI003C76879C
MSDTPFRRATRLARCLCAGAALAAAPQLTAQDRPVAFTGATIMPMVGERIDNGTVVIKDGRIVAIGANVAIPSDAQVRDASGQVIMPGIVDTHSHIGQVQGADRSAPIQPEVRAMDSINPRDHSLDKARAGGVTFANVMPGSGHLMSGQTFYMKLRDGDVIEDVAMFGEDGEMLGGMKMANGTNPMGWVTGGPGTRAKSAALVRQTFIEAQPYCAKDEDEREERDLAKDALCEVLSGERLVHHHTHRADDIMTVLRLQREFGFDLLIQHGMEAGDLAEQLAAANVPVSHILVDAPGGKVEAQNSRITSAADLERAGVLLSLHSDDPIVDSRMMLRQAALAVRGGMTREGALRALTINGARQVGLADRIGSLEVGKDADLIILDGDPLSIYSKVLETWVEGDLVFDRSDPEEAKFATGGYGTASDGRAAAHHHLDREAAMLEGGL